MISLDYIFPEKTGFNFTSHFKENKYIVVKFLDTYTQLCFWATEMEISSYCSYFVAYPRTTQLMTFLVVDSSSQEILLQICDHSSNFTHDIEKMDVLGKIKDIGKKISTDDRWSGLSLNEIFLSGTYDHKKCKIESGDVVVDIGANLGLFSYWGILNGASYVYSFEPTPNLSSVITETFTGLPISVHNLAVWSDEKLLTLNTSRESVYNSICVSTNNSRETIECQGIVLETWARKMNLKIDFLKIDCEGCEWEIIPSMNPEFLVTIPKIVVEYHLHTPESMLKIFSDNGFTTEHNGIMIWAWRE